MQSNLSALREETLAVMAAAMGCVGYVGYTLITATPLRSGATDVMRWSVLSVVLVAIATWALRVRAPHAAALVCVGGNLGATALLLYATENSALGVLFVLPILFSSLLLKRNMLIGAAVGAIVLLSIVPGAAEEGRSLRTIIMLIVMLVTVLAFIAARNTQTTLDWLSHAYQRAMENEQMLREQIVENLRVNKRLDELATQFERANQLLAFERNSAEDARQLKQQFAQTISHELRTPLNLVVAFADLMLQSPELYEAQLPPRYARDLAIIHRNALHLQSLVNDVLDLARIEAAQMALAIERVHPSAIVAEAERTMRSLVEAHGLRLETRMADDLPEIQVDPTRVRQVLINLLSNAVRFTPNGGIAIDLRHDAHADEVVFSITDTGVGIAPQDIGRLFQEFQQIDGSMRRKQGGTGLGLVISKHFVEMHDGRIWVDSAVGVGSRFSFVLPVRRGGAASAAVEVFGEPLPEAQDRRVVLLVTRSAVSADLISRRAPQFRVIHAADEEDVMRILPVAQPQVIVLDSALYVNDAEALRALARRWNLERAVLVSSPFPGEDAVRRQVGGERYLVKPITRDLLAEALRRTAPDARTVMIVDDDHDYVQLLRRMLESLSAGQRICYAHSGAEALAMLQDVRPDVLLLDLQLPDMNGGEIIANLRGRSLHEHVPVIVISAVDGSVTSIKEDPLVIVKPGSFTSRDVLAVMTSAMDIADHAAPEARMRGGAAA